MASVTVTETPLARLESIVRASRMPHGTDVPGIWWYYITVSALVEAFGSLRAVYDAILDDALPAEVDTQARMVIDRNELHTRALMRFLRQQGERS